jgi:hypothetical protein
LNDILCVYIRQHIGMSAIKFAARQASSINVYKNLRSKTLKCNANIYFNKQCLLKNAHGIPECTIALYDLGLVPMMA